MELHLDRNDSRTIGFVVTCLFNEAIELQDLHAWADEVLRSGVTHPDYILELAVFKGPLKDIFKVIGFAPDSELSKSQEKAISGIAYARGVTPYEKSPSKEAALAALERHPEIMHRFREMFPFLR